LPPGSAPAPTGQWTQRACVAHPQLAHHCGTFCGELRIEGHWQAYGSSVILD